MDALVLRTLHTMEIMVTHKLHLFICYFIISCSLFTAVFGSEGDENMNAIKKSSIIKYHDSNANVKQMSVILPKDSLNISSGDNHLPTNGVSENSYDDDWNGRYVRTEIVPASFDINYTRSVNVSTQWMFIYNYTQLKNETRAVRVSVSCDQVIRSYPIMFSARQQEGILAWSVPLDQSDSYAYTAVSHTLCPVNKERRQYANEQQHIFIQVSTSMPSSLNFHLNVRVVEHFELRHASKRSVSVVTAQPKYFKYIFPDDIDQVLLRVTSKSHTCMIVSVQNIKCPVLDLENNIAFEGKHQTMITQSALILQRSDFSDIKGFYLVLLVSSNDKKCSRKFHWYDIDPAEQVRHRTKTVEIKITKATTRTQYIIATMSVVGILLGFYLLAFCMTRVYKFCGSHQVLDDLTSEERERLLPKETEPRSSVPKSTITRATGADERSLFTEHAPPGAYGSLSREDEDDDLNSAKEMYNVIPSNQASLTNSVSNSLVETASLNEDEIDFLPDVESEKDVFRNKIAMYVSDLSRKKRSKLNKYYNQYFWNLVSLAIFYALPAVQLVVTYQRTLLISGDEDMCYYNFDCANPLKSYLISFNNVFSNIGYVMLGFLFILIVVNRDIQHSKVIKKHKDLSTKVGIPQHYGIFYAMGFAMFMEGVMSGSYHVCPNYTNFQFDTSFMYIIACLCMLRIYQYRHIDIGAKSHTAYISMAFVILIAFIGVVFSTNIFWIFYALIHMMVTLFLSAQVYFLGRWNIGWSSFKRFIQFLIFDLRRCSRPVSPNRFIMMLIGNIINWTFALYGAITQPSDFASYLLAIFIGNLLLYCMFYVIMKLLSGERISLLVMACMVTCFVLWGCSLYFFFQHVTSWQNTPSGSRAGNRECILFNFYDSHDVWHFLSAFSIFFSFMILLLLDDDISLKPRNQIPVF